MEPGEIYQKGNIDFGVMGEQQVIILPNEDKEGNQPDKYMYIQDEKRDRLKRIGALWDNKKKADDVVDAGRVQ